MPIEIDEITLGVGGPQAVLEQVGSVIELHAHADLRCSLQRARFRCELGRLDEGEIEVEVPETFVDCTALLATRVSVHAWRGSDAGHLRRAFHGVIVRVEDLGTRVDPGTSELHAVLRLHVAPELWLLSQRKTSRVFHHATALAIVRDVLKDAGLYQAGNLDVRVGDLEGTAIRPREYCVQYQESDLAFVQRLLEEEGLTLLFWHDPQARAELLSIVDGGRPRDEVYKRLDNGGEGDEVDAVLQPNQRALHRSQYFKDFGAVSRVRPSSVSLHDYDFSNSAGRTAAVVTQAAPGPTDPAAAKLAVYEHPGRFVFGTLDPVPAEPAAPGSHAAYPTAPRSAESGARRRVDTRLGELRGDRRICSGRGNVLGMDPGTLFKLRHHPNGEYDREHVVVSVLHELRPRMDPMTLELLAPEERDDALADASSGYSNVVTAIASDEVFRPARVTPKPVIQSVQTALVVGDPGREIHTDYYGRIKVQLHWDGRHHAERNLEAAAGTAPDPDAEPGHLCWVRVAQTWAGPGWGAMFVPRVGMEVVVAFLEGDPDRPLVVGCVYNDANPPPYPLPEHASRSTLRTRSTPVGTGEDRYNELRFEDAAHNEEVHLRAQRDLDEWVGRNRTTRILERNRREVGADEDVQVRGNQQVGVGQSQQVKIGIDQRVTVMGDQTIDVEHDQREHVVGRSERIRGEDVLTVIGDRITTIFGSDVVMSRGPTETVIAPHDPAAGEPRDKMEVEHLESRTVHGSRKQRIDETDDYYAHTVVSLIEDSEKRTIRKSYRVNAGEEANLLVTGLQDPDDDSVGYYVDAKAVRIGSHAKSIEEVMLFRGRDILHIGNEGVLAQADEKPFEIRIGQTGCSIKLSADGKKIEIVALDEIVLRADDHGSSIRIAKDISIDAGRGEVTVSGTKISGG